MFKIEGIDRQKTIARFKIIWISQTQKPQIQEMGLYDSTMAISTGFTVGFNVSSLIFSIRLDI